MKPPLRQQHFGPVRLDASRTRFRLWAPDVVAQGGSVWLELEGMQPLAMRAAAAGWFETIAPARPGMRYQFRLDDGTAVPDPASRGQASDVDSPSIVPDDHAYRWEADGWLGRPWHEAIIYELHVGLLGGFAQMAAHLRQLADLGFTAIELMPIAEFPGDRNWGYDGVLPFAPECSYGTPDALRALVDAAHGLGMMVLLDVVCNHFGPEGNALPRYASAFFRNDRITPWGPAVDFRRPEVRRYYTENVLYWLEDFRMDGLRFDAVHAIDDAGWLPEMAAEVRAAIDPRRHIHLVLENDDNDAALLASGFDAQWNDDGHHALHALLTGECDGYYADYAVASGTAPVGHLARVLAEGFAYQGEISAYRSQHRGSRSSTLPPTAFVLFLQNHDQVGNRAGGERLVQLAHPDALRAAIALQLLGPQIPLVFMGEEMGTPTPFLYFTSHPPALAQAVRDGRRKEFSGMAGHSRVFCTADPNDPVTFAASRLPAQPDNAWTALYRTLLAIRHRDIMARLPGTVCVAVKILDDAALSAHWKLGDGTHLRIWANLGATAVASPSFAYAARWLFESDANAHSALADGRLGAFTVAACLQGVSDVDGVDDMDSGA